MVSGLISLCQREWKKPLVETLVDLHLVPGIDFADPIAFLFGFVPIAWY